MATRNPTQEDHQARSDFVRELVQRSGVHDSVPAAYSTKPPRTIVQFWDDLDQLPGDVRECIESWKKLGEQGFEVLLFDNDSARDFVARRLGSRYESAYVKCYHPAMRSDYFRLCYILMEGGCYLDADDVYHGSAIEHLFNDGRLRIQPLCYDISTNQMVPPSVFTELGANASTWIFYFNNNPLIAVNGHPIVKRALAKATEALERPTAGELPEIQSTTGPGNLTKSIFDLATEQGEIARALLVLCDWEDIAINKWSLSYRHDARNWRLSNQREYQG
ncbi:MAG: glycosyltransferase [Candidatus Bipolaricaulota bacterium]